MDILINEYRQTRMKTKIVFIIVIGLICSCNVLKKSEIITTEDKLVGLWTEHWGESSDVDYVDTLKIDFESSGKFKISCINNSDYVYYNILFNGSKLSFEMENKVDPKEKFILEYTLKLVEENLFTGGMINSKGKKDKIKLKKYIKNVQ